MQGRGVRWTLSGLVAGLVVALVVSMVTESIGNQFFGVSPDAAPGAGAAPVRLIIPVISWALGTFAGGLAAVRLSRLRWEAWVVAAFMMAAAGLNLALMRYPTWMTVAALVAIPAAAWLAQRLAPLRSLERP